MKKQIKDTGNIIDLKGAALLPSGIDAQTHLREPGQSEKETAETGLLAALEGGYSAILTMPNTSPTIACVEIRRQGQKVVDSQMRYPSN